MSSCLLSESSASGVIPKLESAHESRVNPAATAIQNALGVSSYAVFGINMIAQEALAYQRQIVNTGSQNCTGTKSGTLLITQDCMLLAGMC